MFATKSKPMNAKKIVANPASIPAAPYMKHPEDNSYLRLKKPEAEKSPKGPGVGVRALRRRRGLFGHWARYY